MNDTLSSRPPAAAGRRDTLARLARQVSLLREQGDLAGAARLQENEFATALRDLRLAEGPEALPEAELRALCATEAHRVAEAVILAELLLPRLVGNLPAIADPGRRGPVRSTPGAQPVPSTAAGAPTITDLLDAMLAAERNGRLPPATKRES